MNEQIRMLCIQPDSFGARFAFLGVALRWSIGLSPRPQTLVIGPHELELVGSESAFWRFALHHAVMGESLLITRRGRWDVAGSVDGDVVRAFGRKFALRHCLY
ncbi:hypothetical protein AD428_08755 [Achromobacter sp. DMS1]|uniref:hypothetical protein n=1 Tax=Achromobacter sp. DMS1 TaxID=1688405 RepID=UPI00069E4B13|nr:hypothetical protein [Achromobacter sp. DMS1]KOF54160.1 hypothetical protein AD428_08755 [Achromobacter sp. DMS1]